MFTRKSAPALMMTVLACATGFTALTPIESLAETPFMTNAAQPGFGDSLVDAADQGDINAVTSLIRSGKFVDSQGRFGATALMRAAYKGHTEIVSLLLSVGANPNLTDVGAASPLHLAARQGFSEVSTLLLLYDADPNAKDKEGWTPLMRASLHGHDSTADAIITKGADVNARNNLGETALQHATYAGDEAIVARLLANGAEATLKDNNNLSAADLAYQRGHKQILAMLSTAVPAEEMPAAPAPATPPAVDTKPFITVTSQRPVTDGDQNIVTVDGNVSVDNESQEAQLLDEAEAAPIVYAQPALTAPSVPAPIAPAPAVTATSSPKQDTGQGWGLFSFFFGKEKQDAPRDTTNDTLAAAPTAPVNVQAQQPALTATNNAGLAEPAPTTGISNPFAIQLTGRNRAPSNTTIETQPMVKPQDSYTPPVAASLYYLLQLGSFKTEKDAEAHFKELQTTQQDILGDLEPVINRAVIGNQKVTVYRTQAGYLTDKGKAERACADLFGRSVECFVVESAISQPAEVSQPAMYDSNLTAEMAPERPPAPFIPVPRYKPGSKGEEDSPVVPTAKGKLPEFESFTPPPQRSMPAPYPRESSAATPRQPAEVAEAAPAPVSAPAEPRITVYPENAPLPWGSEDKALAISIPESIRQEVYGKPEPESPLIITQSALPVPQPPAMMSPVAPVPVPLSHIPEKSTFAAPPLAARTVEKTQETPAHMTRAYRDYYDGTGVYDANADVRVAEAIRVPLSEGSTGAPTPSITQSLPSRNTGRSSQWVELSTFYDERSATGYWNQLSQTQPQLTDGLRFRVIRPLAARVATNRISVQVGPIPNLEHVQALCSTAHADALKCRTVVDQGKSFAASAATRPPPRSQKVLASGPAPRGRHNRGVALASIETAAPIHDYWVQLSTFNERSEAQESWKTMKSEHTSLFKGHKHHIISPRNSSSNIKLYRLRVGPFDDQMEAMKLCGSLLKADISCISLKD